MTLFKSDNIILHYVDPQIIHAEWCGYFSVDLVQSGCEQLINQIIEKKFRYVINDNRLVKGSWTQALSWLDENFMPRLVAAGIEKIAFIYSPDEGAKYSVNRLLEVNSDYLGQTFNQYDDALNWIKGDSDFDFGNVFLNVKDNSNIDREIPIQDIYFISTANGITTIQTKDTPYYCKATLKSLMENLPQNQFYKIHKSNVVNIKKVNKIKYHAGGYYHAYINDFGNIYLTVGRVYANQLKEALARQA